MAGRRPGGPRTAAGPRPDAPPRWGGGPGGGGTGGSQTGSGGWLSVPGKTGVGTRPEKVKVKALNEKMEEFELEGEGLLARAICHECDHLKGQLYVSLVEGKLEDVMMEEVEE